MFHVCSKRPKTNMEENMDTSPTGPDFYSSPSSPASSRANWHDRDGGDFPVLFEHFCLPLGGLSGMSALCLQRPVKPCQAQCDAEACWQNLTKDKMIRHPCLMQIDLISALRFFCFLTKLQLNFLLLSAVSGLGYWPHSFSLQMICIWFLGTWTCSTLLKYIPCQR